MDQTKSLSSFAFLTQVNMLSLRMLNEGFDDLSAADK